MQCTILILCLFFFVPIGRDAYSATRIGCLKRQGLPYVVVGTFFTVPLCLQDHLNQLCCRLHGEYGSDELCQCKGGPGGLHTVFGPRNGQSWCDSQCRRPRSVLVRKIGIAITGWHGHGQDGLLTGPLSGAQGYELQVLL